MSHNNLAAARRKRGVLQPELAALLGVSVSQISRIETGNRRPRLDEAQKIVAFLDSPIDEVFPEIGRKSTAPPANLLDSLDARALRLLLGRSQDELRRIVTVVETAFPRS